MTSSSAQRGPVHPTDRSHVRFRPASQATITGGFWAERRQVNRDINVPSTWSRLHAAGNFTNLQVVAGIADRESAVNSVWFFDTDVYKWLEAVGWTLTHAQLDAESRRRLEGYVTEAVTLLDRAQAEDGYLQTYYQLRNPAERFSNLEWGHELYNAGHLIQGAIALQRAGDPRLLSVARRFADLIVAAFGPDENQIDGICGHPEIESALVELYRETGDHAYLDAAAYFVDRRGHGLLAHDQFGSQYWQDRVPVRDATAVEGHAVRQLYLLGAVVDLYTESGDITLLTAAVRLWQEMVATRTYLTGGIGTHHRDEAFGDPYELTNDRSYSETCAAIASIMFSWRLLLTTGEAKYADLIERTLYNGFLAGLSYDGQTYVYANPLQIRDGHLHQGNQHDYQRQAWFASACCPPNVMRTLASLEHYVMLTSDSEARLHQYVEGRFSAGMLTLTVATGYPWDGTITVAVEQAPTDAYTLALRIPHWAQQHALTINGNAHRDPAVDGWHRLHRTWAPGDRIVLRLPLQPRYTQADPRVDADRGLVAVERGPLVYCIEGADHPGCCLDDLTVDPDKPPELAEPIEPFTGIATLQLQARRQVRARSTWWPYSPRSASSEAPGEPVTLTAIPYYLWGNRSSGALRVWLRAETEGSE